MGDYLEEKKKEMDEKRNKFGKKDKKPNAGGADDKEVEVKQEEEFILPKGSVLKLTGLGGEITREDIKEVLKDTFEVNIDKDGGDIAFITYEKGEAEEEESFLAESVKDLKNRRNKNRHGHKRKGGF